jgi:hypothetical protein
VVHRIIALYSYYNVTPKWTMGSPIEREIDQMHYVQADSYAVKKLLVSTHQGSRSHFVASILGRSKRPQCHSTDANKCRTNSLASAIVRSLTSVNQSHIQVIVIRRELGKYCEPHVMCQCRYSSDNTRTTGPKRVIMRKKHSASSGAYANLIVAPKLVHQCRGSAVRLEQD